MFVDASAIVAILAREPEADRLSDRILSHEDPLTSAVAIYEATTAIVRLKQAQFDAAQDIVASFLESARIRTVVIGADEAVAALEAHKRFGKGRGHLARLNMGDCFAYACARTNGRQLLFKGDDFGHTDIDIVQV